MVSMIDRYLSTKISIEGRHGIEGGKKRPTCSFQTEGSLTFGSNLDHDRSEWQLTCSLLHPSRSIDLHCTKCHPDRHNFIDSLAISPSFPSVGSSKCPFSENMGIGPFYVWPRMEST